MFNTVMTSLLCLLVVGGLTAEVCWARNLVRQTLRDPEMMEAFRVFGRLIATPFRSVGSSLDQQFNHLVGTAQVVLWPEKKKEEKREE